MRATLESHEVDSLAAGVGGVGVVLEQPGWEQVRPFGAARERNSDRWLAACSTLH